MFVDEIVCVGCGHDPADCQCGDCADIRVQIVRSWREKPVDRQCGMWEEKDGDD